MIHVVLHLFLPHNMGFFHDMFNMHFSVHKTLNDLQWATGYSIYIYIVICLCYYFRNFLTMD